MHWQHYGLAPVVHVVPYDGFGIQGSSSLDDAVRVLLIYMRGHTISDIPVQITKEFNCASSI